MTDLQIAGVAHDANRRYCIALGDESQPLWEDAPKWQIASAVEGVKKIRAHEINSPRDSHQSWLEHKQAEGWREGPVKDAEAKTHPCMVPFEYLPIEHRLKDRLFFGIVKALVNE